MDPMEIIGYAFVVLMTTICSLSLATAIFCFIVLVVQPLFTRKKDDTDA